MRGMAGTYSRLGLTLRALGLAVIITIGDIIVAIASGLGASHWIKLTGVA